jgi:hypothetical protein
MRTRPDGDHGGLIVRGYLFIYLRPTEPVIRTRDSSGATMSQMVGARGQVTRGGPELPQARRQEPREHVTAPELP